MGRTSNSQPRLLAAASDLLWEKSYHSVTVNDVCARAGVNKASLYYFFDSKGALARAALQHIWETVALPAYEKHYSSVNPPLTRIKNFLGWLQSLQQEKFRNIGKVLGWPFFNMGCELGAQEQMVSEELCAIEALELLYFESAIRDAVDLDFIGQTDPRVEALWFRCAVEGILARARILNDPSELSTLTELPAIILRLKSTGAAARLQEGRELDGSNLSPKSGHHHPKTGTVF